MHRARCTSPMFAFAVLALTFCAGVRAEDQVLFSFARQFDISKVETRDVKIAKISGCVRILSGHAQDSPGITLKAPGGNWDLSRRDAIEMRVRNLGAKSATVCLRVDNPGADKPVVIGEFHFGALDRGMFHTGLQQAKDQDDRARLYREYVRGALGNPAIVGCHWFQYQDEPTTGRVYDGENYQIGLVDTVDTPYPETVDAVKEVGYALYETRFGSGR